MQGFYMMSGEVTNLHYREFLYHLKAAGRMEEYEKARVHSEAWAAFGFKDEAAARNYFEHPAYDEYPVVNITQEAARMYCEWLSTAIEVKNPDFDVETRLPTEKEWMYAARGGLKDAPYPNGQYLQNGQGKYFYNFKALGDESIHQDTQTGTLTVKPDYASVFSGLMAYPKPSVSSMPNAFGLYNTSGNVAEMLQEDGRTKGGSFNSTGYDIRIDAPDSYAGFKDASPFIGFRVLLTVKER